MNTVRQEFQRPGNIYRGKPFWAWNGRLEERELRRQIRIMKEMGLGGFFMHSRVGLATPYLGEEWFRLTEACCDEAEKLGMEAWLYDEDRWPSGAAGGLVTCDRRYSMRRLQMDIVPADGFSWPADAVRVFTAQLDGAAAYRVRPLAHGDPLPEAPAHRVLVFRVLIVPASDWYNGETYLDTLSHEAVHRFLEVTHEQYRRRIGHRFGRTVPGIFTDEPNHGSTVEEYLQGVTEGLPPTHCVQIPWTDALPDVFRQRYGYDILDHLPAIFLDVDGKPVHPARQHYHDCKTFLFVDAFARQIGEWCEANGLVHTGHVLYEAPLYMQMNVVGSAMRFYEHMQAPGIDILTEHAPEYTTAKQCSSVLRQCGRRWMLSELYGCTGWDFSFEGHKAVGDWQAALGVTLRCHHLSWYTMEGEAKRDYPASIFYQSPWWSLYRTVEDYFARVGVLLSRGTAIRRLLVVHPIESMWQAAKLNWTGSDERHRLSQQHENLCNWLLAEHIDFDYGDEEMLSRLGRVEAGAPARLAVGDATYDVMLFPPLTTVRSSTLSLARAFLKEGGIVVFAGEPPRYVDALVDPAAQALAKGCVRVAFSRKAIAAAVEPARTLSIADSRGKEASAILYQLREENGNLYLFLCNTDRARETGTLKVRIPLKADTPPPQSWDAETGGIFLANYTLLDGTVELTTSMPPSGSRLFVFPATETETPPLPATVTAERTDKPLGGKWTYQLNEPNVLVLDKAAYRIGDGTWQPAQEVLRVDHAIREALGLPQRGGAMVQPWARPPVPSDAGTPVELAFEFLVRDLPTAPIELAIERPERYRIRLNGERVDGDAESGWWTDLSLRRLPLASALLVPGSNRITLEMRYNDSDGIESAFLLGSFGVEVQGNQIVMVGLPTSLRIGNWVAQGLPFYSGSVVYRRSVQLRPQAGERAFVIVPKFAGSCVRFLVNGQEIGTRGWPPYEVEIPQAVADGSVDLGIEVVSHRRNSHGPLHLAGPKPPWVGSAQFMQWNERWQDSYNLVPCGLLKPPVIRYRKS